MHPPLLTLRVEVFGDLLNRSGWSTKDCPWVWAAFVKKIARTLAISNLLLDVPSRICA